jgi:hypothetical protein
VLPVERCNFFVALSFNRDKPDSKAVRNYSMFIHLVNGRNTEQVLIKVFPFPEKVV